MQTHIPDVVRVIQLSVAPVFLLTAVATLIGTLNLRLGRAVDRRRALQEKQRGVPAGDVESVAELRLLMRRTRLIYFAISAAVIGALLVCLVVGSAFLGALIAVDLTRVVATFFILAMLSLVACLTMFLREVYLAVRGAGVK